MFKDKPELKFVSCLNGNQKEKSFQEKKLNHKGKRKKNPHRPKPEEQEGMPQHEHCPLAKRREDRDPKCHEGQHNERRNSNQKQL
jgi:hypothetical protein